MSDTIEVEISQDVHVDAFVEIDIWEYEAEILEWVQDDERRRVVWAAALEASPLDKEHAEKHRFNNRLLHLNMAKQDTINSLQNTDLEWSSSDTMRLQFEILGAGLIQSKLVFKGGVDSVATALMQNLDNDQIRFVVRNLMTFLTENEGARIKEEQLAEEGRTLTMNRD
tara:strand:+ start:242 stop:748 length:507 start_codon:yes stop_codon:yes gene_type:complete